MRGGPRGPADARRALTAHGIEPPEIRADALLLLSELVANAVLHGGAQGGATLTVHVHQGPAVLRIEVADRGGAGAPPIPPADPGREGGFGLAIVDRIAHRWGLVREHGGTRVWFELGGP